MSTDSDVGTPEPAPILVRAFLDASLEALQFLAVGRDFRSAVTVEQATERGTVAVAPDAVRGVFWACRTFSTAQLKGKVTYGERELVINLIVGPVPSARSAGEYALWEWVAALGGSGGEGGGPWPATAGRVRAEVTTLGAVFREYAPRIAAATPAVFHRLEESRARRRAEWADEQTQWKHRDAAARAADAFRAGDYARVVSLLEPIASRLTPAEQMKLALARKRL